MPKSAPKNYNNKCMISSTHATPGTLAPYAQYHQATALAAQDLAASLPLLTTLHEQFPLDGRVAYLLGTTLLELGQVMAAIAALEVAAKQEQEQQHGHNTQEVLAVAYNAAAMPAHAYQASRRAGLPMPALQEAITEIPQGAYLGDLLNFEQARRQLLQSNGDTVEGLQLIQSFIARFPKYVSAWNVLTSGLFIQGRFLDALQVAQKVLQLDGCNLHALLNIIRCARLLKGLSAARRLRGQILQARVHSEDNYVVLDGPLTLLQAAAILQDIELSEQICQQYPELRQPNSPLLQSLRGRLVQAQQSQAPDSVPLILPSNLLPQRWFSHWQETSQQDIAQVMNRQLASVPGWLEHLPQHLMYENERMSGLFACYLLLQNDRRGMSRLFVEQLEDPYQGTASGRLGVARTLQRFGLLPNSLSLGQFSQRAKQALAGDSSPPLSHAAPANAMTAAEQATMQQAARLMQRGEFVAAVELMEPIANMHSDDAGIQYNLSLAEANSGRSDLQQRAKKRRRYLMRLHPHYLYAPAALAQQALSEGQLAEARALLELPRELDEAPADAYAYFVAVQGLLALHEEKFEHAEQILDKLRQLVGQDTTSYRLLVSEMSRFMKNKANDLRYTKLIAKID